MDVKPFPSRHASRTVAVSIFFSSMLIFVTTLWQHTAAVAAGALVPCVDTGGLSVKIGTLALALSWVSFGVEAVALIGISIMICTIAIINGVG